MKVPAIYVSGHDSTVPAYDLGLSAYDLGLVKLKFDGL